MMRRDWYKFYLFVVYQLSFFIDNNHRFSLATSSYYLDA